MPGRPTRFVLLTKARSGSKWLVELLDSHEGVAVYGEVFAGRQSARDYGCSGVPHFDAYLERVRLRRTRLLAYHRITYLNTLYASRPDAGVVGFKLMHGHMTRGMLQYFALLRVRVVHLMRANVFDAVLSYEVAKARGLYGVRRGDVVPPVKVRLDPTGLRCRLEEHEFAVTRARAAILRYHLPWVDVYYEELVARREETLERILRFLGAEQRADELDSTFVAVDDGPRGDLIENFDDVREALIGTRFEWMLGKPARAESARAAG